MATATKKAAVKATKASAPKTKAARKPSRAALLQALGEETFALFESGALPVPRKLAAAVQALRAAK